MPTRDCNAATRKFPRGSDDALSVSRISCTPALHKLHLPSNKTIGRESAGLNMDGMSNSDDWLCCCCVDLLSARPKRALNVGGAAATGTTAAAVPERDVDVVDLTNDLLDVDVIFCDGEKASTEDTMIVDAMTSTDSRVDEDHVGRLLVDVVAMVRWCARSGRRVGGSLDTFDIICEEHQQSWCERILPFVSSSKEKI